MYYAHFGLAEPPFRITPNTEVFFSGGNRGAILEALIYALSQGEGIIKVTGEVGSGKTMLCTMLQTRLPAEIETIYLAHPSVSPEEILHAIAFELQLPVARDAGRMQVMQALHAHLLERHGQGRQVVMFVEESQNMPLATLEEVRLLSNLETGRHKLLQIVLFGQPELDDNLRQPQIRQLRERITHSFQLQPLAAHEVGEYLMFRMRAAGYRGPDVFSPRVVKLIAQASMGLSRRINLIADKALLAAFSENTHTVKLKHVQAAIRDSEFARDMIAAQPPRPAFTAAMLGLGAIAGAALFYLVHLLARDPAQQAHQPAAAGVAPLPIGKEAETPPALPAQPPSTEPQPSAAPTESPVTPPLPITPSSPEAPAAAPPIAATGAVAGAQQASEPIRAEPPAAAGPVRETDEKSASKAGRPRAGTLEARLEATREWLRTERDGTFTIQLLGAENAEHLKDHLNIIGKFVEINNIFVYRTTAKQKPYLTVLYGSYESREAAQDAMTRLPAQLRAFRPYLRTVQGVRAEIGQRDAAP